MPLLEKLADYLEKRGKGRVIYDRVDTDPYLIRYYVIPRWLTFGLFRVVIHKFLRSDSPDDGVHDHPWPYISVVLKGGYYEWLAHPRKQGEFWCSWRGPGSVIFARATRRHRVELKTENHWFNNHTGERRPVPAWTLFVMGPRRRTWYFYVEGVKHHWKDWIARRQAGKNEDQKWREND